MTMTLSQSRRGIHIFVVVSAITFLAYSVSFGLVLPLERLASGRPEIQAIVLFLPHGVKIIAAWMLGWWSLPFMLPIVVLSDAVFEGVAPGPINLALCVLTLVTAPLAFDLFRLAGIDLGPQSGRRVPWRALPLVGFVASVMNVIPIFFLEMESAAPRTVLFSMVSFVLGDTLGVIVALFVAMLAYRWWRRHGAF
ncbi:MAG: hypothetical protein GC186_11560 [Rhodobacteraceae bacterium]|nr:hypothetical protein [Paracoccaceae bacterium]